jgi:hypothetical protein
MYRADEKFQRNFTCSSISLNQDGNATAGQSIRSIDEKIDFVLFREQG